MGVASGDQRRVSVWHIPGVVRRGGRGGVGEVGEEGDEHGQRLQVYCDVAIAYWAIIIMSIFTIIIMKPPNIKA